MLSLFNKGASQKIQEVQFEIQKLTTLETTLEDKIERLASKTGGLENELKKAQDELTNIQKKIEKQKSKLQDLELQLAKEQEDRKQKEKDINQRVTRIANTQKAGFMVLALAVTYAANEIFHDRPLPASVINTFLVVGAALLGLTVLPSNNVNNANAFQ